MAIRPHLDPEIAPDIVRNRASQTRKKSHLGFLLLLLVLALALAAGVVFELMARKTHDQTLSAAATADVGRPPVVNVARVERAPAQSIVELPCQTVPKFETPIYARADGYLKQRPVDIGYRVKKGDLLVEIETPELDQQIVQGEATLAQSRAASGAVARQPSRGARQYEAGAGNRRPVAPSERQGSGRETGSG